MFVCSTFDDRERFQVQCVGIGKIRLNAAAELSFSISCRSKRAGGLLSIDIDCNDPLPSTLSTHTINTYNL